jgi:hypothetical protein
MPNTPAGMRECPTRADGTDALFAHVIGAATCQQRQREHYHKCPTCSFYNARAGLTPASTNGHPAPGARRLPPLEVPSRRLSPEPSRNGEAPAAEPVELTRRAGG